MVSCIRDCGLSFCIKFSAPCVCRQAHQRLQRQTGTKPAISNVLYRQPLLKGHNMKALLTIALALCSIAAINSQNKIASKFYKDIWQNQETNEKNAKYIENTAFESDSVTKKTFLNIKSQKLLWEKRYLNEKPYGIWNFYDENGILKYSLDYNFILKYGQFRPEGFFAVDILQKSLKDNISGTFEMPEYGESGKTDISFGVAKNLRYPLTAQEKGIQGKVMLQFTIDTTGVIGNISILRGVHESLDREAFRVIHLIKKVEPAKLNGQSIPIYIEYPVVFMLQ